jgi:hypothetical protein
MFQVSFYDNANIAFSKKLFDNFSNKLFDKDNREETNFYWMVP